MPSAFEDVVRRVIWELDRSGKLIPVDSLQNSSSFRPYSLLRRKPPSSWFWKPRYSSVNLSIKDILEPDVPVPDLECGSTIHICDNTDGKVQGKVEVAVPGQGKIAGGAAVSGSSSTSMNLCTLSVNPNTWDHMQQERRLRQPEHKILQELRSRRDDVYVVKEVVQIQQEVVVSCTRKLEGSGQCALPAAMCLKVCGQPWALPDPMTAAGVGEARPTSQGAGISRAGFFPDPSRRSHSSILDQNQSFPKAELATTNGKPVPSTQPKPMPITLNPEHSPEPVSIPQGDGEGHFSQENTVTIPAGSIIAFRVAQLVIDTDWNKKQRTFPPPSTGSQPQHTFSLSSVLGLIHERFRLLTDSVSEKWEITEDFQGLRTEVEAGSAELQKMERDLRQQLLLNLEKILCDPSALEDLEALLAQGLCGARQVKPLHGPADDILECLVLPSRMLVPELAAPVFYLLGALSALSETQQQLLAKLLDKGDLSTQLELVDHLLEQSTPWQKQSDVSLPPRLSESNWGEEAPSWTLLEECGLELQVGAPQIHWEPQAQGPTCALYASLALLSGLSRESC
nr:gasdermin-D isoform X2 [Cavia porcellus]